MLADAFALGATLASSRAPGPRAEHHRPGPIRYRVPVVESEIGSSRSDGLAVSFASPARAAAPAFARPRRPAPRSAHRHRARSRFTRRRSAAPRESAERFSQRQGERCQSAPHGIAPRCRQSWRSRCQRPRHPRNAILPTLRIDGDAHVVEATEVAGEPERPTSWEVPRRSCRAHGPGHGPGHGRGPGSRPPHQRRSPPDRTRGGAHATRVVGPGRGLARRRPDGSADTTGGAGALDGGGVAERIEPCDATRRDTATAAGRQEEPLHDRARSSRRRARAPGRARAPRDPRLVARARLRRHHRADSWWCATRVTAFAFEPTEAEIHAHRAALQQGLPNLSPGRRDRPRRPEPLSERPLGGAGSAEGAVGLLAMVRTRTGHAQREAGRGPLFTGREGPVPGNRDPCRCGDSA